MLFSKKNERKLKSGKLERSNYFRDVIQLLRNLSFPIVSPAGGGVFYWDYNVCIWGIATNKTLKKKKQKDLEVLILKDICTESKIQY